jgi:GT2 family glycosyltransferase/glycosyltransferase involved in cell wall biosynthesis
VPSTVDIVVPVYRGEAETKACLLSVLAARNQTAHEVVVVDDASPEPAIREWLRSLAAERRITLLVHEANRGFVASVNEAMALHAGRDVVLLNSDTEVADGWLDRLSRHAAAEGVGTVTPFSSNATICSYPRTLLANPLPAVETTASLDAAFAAANAGRSVEIPTAVGFCMYIARQCLEATGPFDEARYGAGYGEEVDFCMRAARQGFRHLLAGDVFVRHVGEVSFGGSGGERRERAQALVDSLYPEFQQRLRDYLARDPSRMLRRRADLERLRRSPRPRLLFVSHRFGGGIKRHVDELAAALEAEYEVLLLQPNAHSFVTLRWLRAGEELALWLLKDAQWPQLVALLRAVGISRLHLHHVEGLPAAILDLPRELECPHDVTLHDYFAVCPQYHLVDGSGRYCGEPGGTQCMKCGELAPLPWPVSIPEWRRRFGEFLGQAGRVIAPSRDCAARVSRYFPDVSAQVRPHPQEVQAAAARVRVLVPGALSPAKGVDLLEACVLDARSRGLPLHFRVLGYVARPLPEWPDAPLSVSGEYPEGTLATLLASEAGDVAFFPAQCPETYSYTLTDVMASGLAIVATDLGALPERLAGHANATLLPWNAPASAFNDALLAAAARRAPAPAIRPGVSLAEYAAEYRRALPPTACVRDGPLPELQPAMLADPREPMAIPTLVQLFDDGVRCGVAASRQALRDRAQVASAELAHVKSLAERLGAQVEQAEAGNAAAQARIAQLEASTSWRLTAPLRALVRLMRGR